MPSEKWSDGGRELNGFLFEDILYWSLAPWDEDVVIMVTMYWILPWRRRLLPVATRRRLVLAEYFVARYLSVLILFMCFLKNFETLISLFLNC